MKLDDFMAATEKGLVSDARIDMLERERDSLKLQLAEMECSKLRSECDALRDKITSGPANDAALAAFDSRCSAMESSIAEIKSRPAHSIDTDAIYSRLTAVEMRPIASTPEVAGEFDIQIQRGADDRMRSLKIHGNTVEVVRDGADRILALRVRPDLTQ